MNKNNISRDEIADAMKNEFGFNRKLCLDMVNDIIDIIERIYSDRNLLNTIKSNIQKKTHKDYNDQFIAKEIVNFILK